jgi:hypothetical protein
MDIQLKSGQKLTFEPRGTALNNALKAAKTDRERANALVALGRFNISSGQIERAVAQMNSAYELDPKNPNVLHHYGLAQMRVGGVLAGIQNYDLGRWNVPQHRVKYHRAFDFPKWTGQSLKGKRILLWAEQGVGDQIMHARSIPILKAMGCDVSLECDPRLNTLFERSFGKMTFFVQGTKPDPALNDMGFDYQCSLFSAWQWAKPANTPPAYLTADPQRTTVFKAHLKDQEHKLNIGLSWSSAAKANGSKRTIQLPDMKPFFDIPDIGFHSLQYGVNAQDLLTLRRKTKLPIRALPKLDAKADIDGLASAMQAMDLIISIDNSTVHLSGALGVPTWVMLPRSGEWRWGQDDTENQLYSNMSLYRNKTAANWPVLTNTVAIDLKAYAKSKIKQEERVKQ